MSDREVVLQKMVDVAHSDCIGYEVLTRLVDLDGTLCSPAGKTHGADWLSIDRYVLATVARWGEEQCEPSGTLYINVSSETLTDNQGFRQWCLAFDRTLGHYDGPIALEVSERTPTDVLQHRWPDLASFCAELVIDDYGQGLALDGRLKGFPWRTCKFEAERLEQDRDAVGFCHRHDIQTVVEKVESRDQAQMAWQLGISTHQGFLYSHPVEASIVLANRVTV